MLVPMPKHLVLISSLLATAILLILLNFTTPTEVGPFGVLVFFATFYVLMFGVATLAVRLFGRLAGKQRRNKDYLYAAVVAFGPIMLMLAQSLGGVSFLTLLLVAVFVFLGCFLVSKRVSMVK